MLLFYTSREVYTKFGTVSLHHYGISFVSINDVKNMDAVILAVAHDAFHSFNILDMDALFAEGKKVFLDVKGLMDRNAYEAAGYDYWRL